MYSLLNKLSGYIYFYKSKNFISYTFVACFPNRQKPSVYPLDYWRRKFYKNMWYFNLAKGERNALYSLRDDTSITIKEDDKGSDAVICVREDYLAESKKQLADKEVYEELRRHVEGPLDKVNKKGHEEN